MRPIVRYHGGKWKLAPWIISNFPEHRVYTEAFGGGGSVLLRKPRCYAEIYNDLDGEMVSLFRVARDRGDELVEALKLTPFARDEYLEAWYPSEDPLEQARRTVIRGFMGFGSAAITLMRKPEKGSRGGLARTGFRSNSNRSGTTPAHDWANYPDALETLIERLRGIVIENKDALKVIETHDSVEALHYVDPPYPHSTRDAGGDYRYEMTDEQHVELATALHNLKGAVVLSGYACDLYDKELYRDWIRVDRAAHADGALDRVEVLWMNREPPQAQMFAQPLGDIRTDYARATIE